MCVPWVFSFSISTHDVMAVTTGQGREGEDRRLQKKNFLRGALPNVLLGEHDDQFLSWCTMQASILFVSGTHTQ